MVLPNDMLKETFYRIDNNEENRKKISMMLILLLQLHRLPALVADSNADVLESIASLFESTQEELILSIAEESLAGEDMVPSDVVQKQSWGTINALYSGCLCKLPRTYG